MALIKTFNGVTPVMGDNCFLAENATVIGRVVMGNQCTIWFNTVLRGDVNTITIGDKVNIQDGAVVHCTYQKAKTVIGNNVSIGHNAIIHGCTLEDNVLVGMGAIIMDHAVVEKNSIIAAGAVVLENTRVPSGSIYAGVPARKVKDVDPIQQKEMIERIANNYVMYAGWFNDAEK